jgi:hypothetical protein
MDVIQPPKVKVRVNPFLSLQFDRPVTMPEKNEERVVDRKAEQAYAELSFEVQASSTDLMDDAWRYDALPFELKKSKGLPQTFEEIMKLRGTKIPQKTPGKFANFFKGLFQGQSDRAKMYYKVFDLLQSTKKETPLSGSAKKTMKKAAGEAKGRASASSSRERPKGLV